MTAHRSAATAARFNVRLSILLLVAIVPTLTYFGHWPVVAVDIPGTDFYIQLPGSEGHPGGDDHGFGATAGSHSDAHEHAQHCHGDTATCTDMPFTGASAFALMEESLAALGIAGLLTLVALQAWRSEALASVGPELQPPKSLLSA